MRLTCPIRVRNPDRVRNTQEVWVRDGLPLNKTKKKSSCENLTFFMGFR